ncbi:MAG: TerB family tellurite resistance protein [Candidatus Omnitrophota bacterium]|nr:MAG: TerB family tellurite resistance protein [Candidatus Omnitrophota bacterium]
MAGFLNQFRRKVVSSVWKDQTIPPPAKDIDDKIALGVLLWVVAEADEKFLPQEEEKIKEVLLSYAKISAEDLSLILASIKAAADESIDLHQFTSEVSHDLVYAQRVTIVEHLFRIACVDKELDDKELDLIRQISGLFHLSHRDFIDAKIKAKKEFGLKTVE